jgi:hypothetical protein
MRILSLDVETTPNLAYVWDLFGRGVSSISNDKLVETSQIMCFSAKWIEQRTADTDTMFHSDFFDGHSAMVAAAWKLLDTADVLVTYNGNHFDEPRLNREFISQGLMPPAPYQRVDLYRVVKKKFAFPSGKLDFVCQELGLGAKTKHDGFSLWVRCMAGDAEAWAMMEEYNRQDVVLNEELYRVMLPWIPSLPSYGAETGEDVCPACGSANLCREGFAYTKTGRFQRYSCNSCHSWSRSSHRDAHTEIVQVAA